MRKISEKQLKDLHLRGRVVGRGKKPEPIKQAPPEPVKASETNADFAKAAADSMRQSAVLMNAIRERIETIEGKPAPSYRFTINRTSSGYIDSVDAVPVTSSNQEI